MSGNEGRLLDATTLRAWCATALDALGRAREEIDSINVYPVADGDTGTNLYLTSEAAFRAVEAVFEAYGDDASPAAWPGLDGVARAMAHGALVGARGNSGTILAQLLRGAAQVLVEAPGEAVDGVVLAAALRRAAEAAYEAVAHPVEGTVLTVASAAAHACPSEEADCRVVARAAYDAARDALKRTPGQLAALGRAGVVDAGGRGFVAVLAALVAALGGEPFAGGPVARPVRWQPRHPETSRGEPGGAEDGARAGGVGDADDAAFGEDVARGGGVARGDDEASRDVARRGSGDVACRDTEEWDGSGPGYEVIYLLDAEDEAVARLRARLDALGESLVVVGGDGLWHVHVHVDDAGAAVEAGIEAGRPHRVRITHFASDAARPAPASGERVPRAIVAVVPGEGLAELYAEAGAATVPARPGELPGSGELAEAVRRAHAHEVVLLPNDAALHHTAAAAARDARHLGVRVAVIPTRSAVQGVAALAVHEAERRFDEDVVAMTSAAGATRYAELAVAEHRSWTSVGICQAGDVLGLIDGDVVVIGQNVAAIARTVLDRMLAAGGEMVTLVLGEDCPETLADDLERHVRAHHLAVDTVVYEGGRDAALLLVGVE
ncbi:DAK2 domain-containing protein [Streptomyces sp. GZWMJZ-114]|uniref:DAK2 domain-containing protein n=1 Tax=Streptomyces sp. GZWMJZ-114 TaxID=2494734 RepID=UPI0013E94F25|nr:DAK2 domain-containing protein [Streptomyces sp. GZWMJZ-114]